MISTIRLVEKITCGKQCDALNAQFSARGNINITAKLPVLNEHSHCLYNPH